MLNFQIQCKNCDSTDIQSTLSDWEGYSEYTVLEDSKLEFKCRGCGKWGSSDNYESPRFMKIGDVELQAPNDYKNFIVRCACGEQDNFTLHDTLDDDVEKVHIECNKCGRKDA